jgi:hypothetical protein
LLRSGPGAKKVAAMTGLVQPSFAEKGTTEQTFELIKEETTQFIERTVARIARGDSVEAGLRELEAFTPHDGLCETRSWLGDSRVRPLQRRGGDCGE